jgi:hypothetical protein
MRSGNGLPDGMEAADRRWTCFMKITAAGEFLRFRGEPDLMHVPITILTSLNAATLELISFPINFHLVKKNLICTRSSGTIDHPPTVAYTMGAAARENERGRSRKCSTIRRRILPVLPFSHLLRSTSTWTRLHLRPQSLYAVVAKEPRPQVSRAFLLSSGNRGLQSIDFNAVLVIIF